MAKVHCFGKIWEQEQLQSDIFSMWIDVPQIAEQAKAGQFVSLFSVNGDTLLPRPISLCEIDTQNGRIRLVYRVVGSGTREFSLLKKGDSLKIMGPLGNGFPLTSEPAIIVGGGIGIPPLIQLAKELSGKVTLVVGYRDSNTFLMEELKTVADEVLIATEDGSIGTKGNVIHAMNEQKAQGKVVYSCGPIPMLRGVKEWASEKGVPAWISMEEKMACGIGACLACVCSSTEQDDHSKVCNKRICKDGPVFLAEEIDL